MIKNGVILAMLYTRWHLRIIIHHHTRIIFKYIPHVKHMRDIFVRPLCGTNIIMIICIKCSWLTLIEIIYAARACATVHFSPNTRIQHAGSPNIILCLYVSRAYCHKHSMYTIPRQSQWMDDAVTMGAHKSVCIQSPGATQSTHT